jgi:hypothetical protein
METKAIHDCNSSGDTVAVKVSVAHADPLCFHCIFVVSNLDEVSYQRRK